MKNPEYLVITKISGGISSQEYRNIFSYYFDVENYISDMFENKRTDVKYEFQIFTLSPLSRIDNEGKWSNSD